MGDASDAGDMGDADDLGQEVMSNASNTSAIGNGSSAGGSAGGSASGAVWQVTCHCRNRVRACCTLI
jgi:hypothetical protein